MNGAETVSIGSYADFPCCFPTTVLPTSFAWYSKGKLSHTAVLGADAGGNVTRIDNALEDHGALGQRPVATCPYHRAAENARTEMTRTLSEGGRTGRKTRRLNELNVLLNLNEQDRPVMADEPDEG